VQPSATTRRIFTAESTESKTRKKKSHHREHREDKVPVQVFANPALRGTSLHDKNFMDGNTERF